MRLLTALFVVSVASSPAVLIDEIAVTVGSQAITRTEILREIRLAALLNGDSPDVSDASRKAASDRLVEQALIRREMTFGNYPSIPPAQVDATFAETEKARGGSVALDRLLKSYDLTAADLRAYLQWQLSLLKFIDLRFRPSVQVTKEDVEKYYRENVLAQPGPEGKAPTLAELQDKIEQKLTGERVDKQVDDWIQRARSRTHIRYLDASLGSTAPAPLKGNTTQPH